MVSEKTNSLIGKIGTRKLLTGFAITILLLMGIFYYNFKSKNSDKKIESEQLTSKSADSMLIKKLSNIDTITSLQDPIDTVKESTRK